VEPRVQGTGCGTGLIPPALSGLGLGEQLAIDADRVFPLGGMAEARSLSVAGLEQEGAVGVDLEGQHMGGPRSVYVEGSGRISVEVVAAQVEQQGFAVQVAGEDDLVAHRLRHCRRGSLRLGARARAGGQREEGEEDGGAHDADLHGQKKGSSGTVVKPNAHLGLPGGRWITSDP
jgi:hypothetical protein